MRQDQPDKKVREALRTYFLTGESIRHWPVAGSLPRPVPAGYPLCAAETVRPLFSVVKDLVERDPSAFPILATHLPALTDRLTGPPETWAATLAERAGLTPDTSVQVQTELARIHRRLPKDAKVINLSAGVFADLVCARLAASRRSAQARLLAEVTTVRDRVLEVLRPEQSEEETFGANASRFLDVSRLAALPRSSGSQTLPPSRRERLSQTLAALEDFVASANQWPLFWALDIPAALDRAANLMGQLNKLLRAMRVAQLECDGAYEEARHSGAVARLQASPEDLLSLPPVIAFTTGAEFDKLPIGAWTHFLQSRLPVTVLLEASDPTTVDLFLLRLAFGQALVGQTAMSHINHMLETIDQIAAATGPVVMLHSRNVWAPLFRHSQRGGLQIQQLLSDPVAPADAPLIPPEAWEEEQVELAEWPAKEGSAIPFVWVDARDGTRHRAVLSAAAVVHYQRLAAWREELSYRPALPPPAPAPAEEVLEEARKQGAAAAVVRLVEYLTGVLPGPVEAATQPLPAAAPVAPAPAPTPAKAAPEAQPAPSPAQEAASADPYIDSFLCTSCNDCMKVNPRLFLYDGNKQAYLGPLSAGTYADLVKAAEGCPAKCIHPGTPRPGDASATSAVLARAGKLK